MVDVLSRRQALARERGACFARMILESPGRRLAILSLPTTSNYLTPRTESLPAFQWHVRHRNGGATWKLASVGAGALRMLYRFANGSGNRLHFGRRRILDAMSGIVEKRRAVTCFVLYHVQLHHGPRLFILASIRAEASCIVSPTWLPRGSRARALSTFDSYTLAPIRLSYHASCLRRRLYLPSDSYSQLFLTTDIGATL